MSKIREFAGVLSRKKQIDRDPAAAAASQLRRCLSVGDLILLGIGNTLGAGIYVVTGEVAKWVAGPAIIVSFMISAIAAVLAGVCYAELGARVPKAGSAYVYTYVTMGEFIGFFVGWSVLVENILASASVARATTAYIDSMIGNKMDDFLSDNLAIHTSWLAAYPDFFGSGCCLISAVLIGFGVKTSTIFNNVFTVINGLVLVYVVICGLFKIVPSAWSIPVDDLPKVPCDHYPESSLTVWNTTWTPAVVAGVTGGGPPMCSEYGSGGFFPYGAGGMFAGASVCFYAFLGFEVVATAGEEVRDPQRTLPIGILVSLFFTFLAYVSVSAIMTLMCPYFLLDEEAPLPVAFDKVGWYVARYVIAVGGICGLVTSLYGCMFALPRYMYSMAEDGMIFRCLGNVHSRFKTPLYACLASGIISGLITLVVDLQSLVGVVVMGAMFPFLVVAACVIVLRYEPDMSAPVSSHTFIYPHIDGYRPGFQDAGRSAVSKFFSQAFRPVYDEPTPLSSRVVTVCVALFTFACFGLDAVIIFAGDSLGDREPWAVVVASIIGAFILLLMVVICRQPQSTQPVAFKVPLVPLVPALSVFIDSYLLMKMDARTWMRYLVFMCVGVVIYFAYSIWNSNERYIKRDAIQSSTSAVENRNGCSHHDIPRDLRLDVGKTGNIQHQNEATERTRLLCETQSI